MAAMSALPADAPDLPDLALKLDSRFAKAAHQVCIITCVGLQPRDADKLLIVDGVTDHFHGSPDIMARWDVRSREAFEAASLVPDGSASHLRSMDQDRP
jgi:hypothetical protein